MSASSAGGMSARIDEGGRGGRCTCAIMTAKWFALSKGTSPVQSW